MPIRTQMTPLFNLRRDIDRLWEEALGARDNGSTWMPAVDIRETSEDLSIDFELPGLKPEDVEITTENGVLTVRGEKRGERTEGAEGSRFHLVERTYGSFTRSFQLPQGVNEDKIAAEFDNGVLRVRVPKAALPQPKRIQIGKGASSEVKGSSSEVKGTGSRTEKNVRREPSSEVRA